MEENKNNKMQEITEKSKGLFGFLKKNKKKIIIGGVVVTSVVVLIILAVKYGPSILDKIAKAAEVTDNVVLDVGGEVVAEAVAAA